MSTKQVKAVKFPGTTIRLSDTIDQFSRKVHINVRNDKVTLVYRWKARLDNRAHTQRITLDDSQAARLLGAVSVAAVVAIGEDNLRGTAFGQQVTASIEKLGAESEK